MGHRRDLRLGILSVAAISELHVVPIENGGLNDGVGLGGDIPRRAV